MKGALYGQMALATLGLAALMLLSWGASRQSQNQDVAYVFVIDFSGSTQGFRRTELGLMLQDLDAAPQGASVVVYRMGSKTQEIFSGHVGEETADEIIQTAMRDLEASDPKAGTNFADMANGVATFCRLHPQQKLHIQVLTDGGDDFANDPKSVHMYREAAKSIASSKNLDSLIFQGVAPGYREGIRQAFASAGQKLQIWTLDEVGQR